MVTAFIRPILVAGFMCAVVLPAAAQPAACPSDRPLLFYHPDPGLDAATGPGFAASIAAELAAAVPEIGYCLAPADTLARYRDSTSRADNLVLYAAASASSGQTEVLVAVMRLGELGSGDYSRALGRPLVSMIYSAEDVGGMRTILVKKIIENLRTQYICYLSLDTDPPGATVRTQSGLVDRTPVNWVMPVGSVEIEGRLAHYLPMRKTVDLPKPGTYHYSLQLRKRQFYHSGFIYPAAIFAATGAICYGLDRLYYDRYLRLGEADYRENPDAFARTYYMALNFERAALASAALAVVSLGLTFWF